MLVSAPDQKASPSNVSAKTPRAVVDSAAMALAQAALAKLNLEEKIGLLAGNGTMTLAALPKIGLEEEFWFSDGPHTVRPELDRNNFNSANRDDDHSTVLPTLSALAATWDPQLAFTFGQTLGREARDRGKDVLLGPGVNLHRTPLNGRNYEYLGEDPYLASQLAVAYVRGVQSQDVAACVKHFVGNDQELARGSVNVVMDERTLRELYLAPFEAAIVEGGALTVMNGYNRFRGEFCSHNAYLNRQVLRTDWGFPGFVVSDWGGVHGTIEGALGGLDVEMHAGEAIRHYRTPLVEAVRDGRVPASVVDEMALHVLYVMSKIGKLGGKSRAGGARNLPSHHQLAREVAEQAIVLLKNDLGLLPLNPAGIKKLVLIGANADTRHTAGGWSAEGKPLFETTPLVGLRHRLSPDVKIQHIPGPFAEHYSQLPEDVIETINTADLDRGAAQKGWRTDYHIRAGGENPADEELTAPGFDRLIDANFASNSPYPDDLLRVVWSVEIKAQESGVHRFCFDHDGRIGFCLDDQGILEVSASDGVTRSVVDAPLQAGCRYRLTVNFKLPSAGKGSCRFGWLKPSQRPTKPEELPFLCLDADAVLFLTGNRLGHGRAQECEGGDRPDLSLPEGDDAAIAAVLAARPDTVVITQSGSPVAMPWVEQASTLLHYWFCGMDGGSALARVLFGDVNPSGRLPFTFPCRLEDSPAHALGEYGPIRVEYREGVFIGYRWHDAREIDPLFPFGHGLSYTTFRIGAPELDETSAVAGAELRVRVPVTNTGARAGSEVVQLYVTNPEGPVPRPVRELRAFAKLTLAPGETRTVDLTLPPRAFAYWDVSASGWRVAPGLYQLQAGASSRRLSVPVPIRILAA